VPVLVLFGRESVSTEATDDALLAMEAKLVDKAMG
jgi:hypothetical protein